MRSSFHAEALAEYREATRYYSQQAKGLGEKFVSEVEAAVKAAITSPKARAANAQGTRRYLLPHFPFAVHYVVERVSTEIREEIVIYAVRHVRRDQGSWLHRLPKASE